MHHEAELSEAIQANNYGKALLETEKLIQKFPREVRYHMLVGKLEMLLQQYDLDRQAIYQQVLEAAPQAFTTRLLYGALLDQQRIDVEQAFSAYTTALRAANGAGFWVNDASTPQWCRPLVVQALRFVDEHRQRVISQWIAEYETNYSASEIQRVVKGMQMYGGVRPLELEDDRQRPSFFYVPGLPAKPVFDREDLEFIEFYESQYSDISADLDTILANNISIENYRDEDKHGLTTGGDWDALFFYRHGKTYTSTHQQSPKTSAVLQQLPIVHIPNHSPEICFSVLRPGAHILPHRGVTNTRSVLHLGLKIPNDCALNIRGIEQLEWQPGKAFAFDDTYEHEAWNRSEESRFVLLADIWNPFLSEVEQEVISDFVVKVGQLNSK